MSDDREEKKDTAGAKQQPEGEPSNTVPWVPDDEYRRNPARDALGRWRPSRAVLDTNDVFPPSRSVIVPPQQPPENLQPVLSSGVGPIDISLSHTVSVVPDWRAVRAEMIPRLDAIEAGLRELAPVIERFEVAYREHARIGHNNPPEDIDILPIDLAELELGIAAANLWYGMRIGSRILLLPGQVSFVRCCVTCFSGSRSARREPMTGAQGRSSPRRLHSPSRGRCTLI